MGNHFIPAKARGLVAVRAEASGDIKALIEGVNKDFEAFKAALAEKDKEVSAKFDDVVTTDKLDKINASVGELQAEIDKLNAVQAATGVAGGQKPLRDAEYTEAFRSHFRKGDIQANLVKGTDADGGYLAPVEWDRTITDKLVEVSMMRSIAGIQSISGTSYTKLFNLRGTSSGWVGETNTRSETGTATFGQMTIATGEIYANPAATQTLLDDAEVDVEAWLAGEVNTEFAQKEGAAFVAGDGSNKPNGFLTYITGAANASANPLGAVATKDLAAVAAVTEDELLDMIYGISSSYTAGARFVSNRTTMGTVRKLRDADGRQLWQPSSQAGEPSTLLGYAHTELQDMPNMEANATPLAFGNFQRAYLIVDRMGVRVLRDPFTNKPFVMFYTTKRVGGAVVDPQGLIVAKNAAS